MGALLDRFIAAGVRFEPTKDGKLRALGTLTDELRAAIRANKPAILAELVTADIDALDGEAYDGFESTLSHKAENEATHWRWRILFPEGRAIEIRYRPEVSRKEVEGHYPGAAVVSLPDQARKRTATPAEQMELAALVASVYADETQTERNEALTTALADPDDALACYRTLAIDRGLARALPDQDNRRWCTDCANLAVPDRDGTRRCLAAAYGELEDGVKRTYHPTTDIPRRCEAFTPLAGDPDQRTGAELWPYLGANNQRPNGGGRTQ